MIAAAVMVAHILDLGVAVVAWGDDVVCTGFDDLIELHLSVGASLFGLSPLQGTAAAAAAKIVGSVGDHVDEILFTHNGFHDKTKIVQNFVGPDFSTDVAGILHREFDVEILVPVGVDFEFSLFDPLGIELDDADEFKGVRDIVFSQSFQD